MLIDRLNNKHPLANKTIRILLRRPEHDPFNIHGKMLVVQDWWHRIADESWRDGAGYGLAVCKQYALRRKDKG